MNTQTGFILRTLAEMPMFLNATITGLSSQWLTQTTSSDKDFLLSHVCHMADCEAEIYGWRIRQMLSADCPELPGIDPMPWPTERRYAEQDVTPQIKRFGELRSATIERLAKLDDAQWGRTGLRFNGERCNVFEIAFDAIEHDSDHKMRIARVLREMIG
jgi:DinB superfamily